MEWHGVAGWTGQGGSLLGTKRWAATPKRFFKWMDLNIYYSIQTVISLSVLDSVGNVTHHFTPLRYSLTIFSPYDSHSVLFWGVFRNVH